MRPTKEQRDRLRALYEAWAAPMRGDPSHWTLRDPFQAAVHEALIPILDALDDAERERDRARADLLSIYSEAASCEDAGDFVRGIIGRMADGAA